MKILVSRQQLRILREAVEQVWDDPAMFGYCTDSEVRSINRLYDKVNKICYKVGILEREEESTE